LRVIEVVPGEIEALQMSEAEEAGLRVDRTGETTVAEVEASHVACPFITIHAIPITTIPVF